MPKPKVCRQGISASKYPSLYTYDLRVSSMSFFFNRQVRKYSVTPDITVPLNLTQPLFHSMLLEFHNEVEETSMA